MSIKELGKKGSIPDVLFFPIKLVIGAIALVLIGFFMLQFGDKLEGTQIQSTETGNNSIRFFQDIGTTSIPGYFTILFAFDVIGIIATSFLITLSPIFFIIYIIFIAFAVVLSAFSMILYDRFSEVSAIATYIEGQGMINMIMQYAPVISLVVGVLSAIIIMAKIPGGGQDI